MEAPLFHEAHDLHPDPIGKLSNAKTQDELIVSLMETIREEDQLLECALADHRRSDAEWDSKMEQVTAESTTNLMQYKESVATMAAAIYEHQQVIGKVADRVKEVMKDYPREFEDHEESKHDVTDATIEKDAAISRESGNFEARVQLDYFDKVRAASPLGRIVCSTRFDTMCTIVIIVNAVFIGISVEYDIQHAKEAKTAWQKGFEIFFYIFYLVELILKLKVHERHFFNNPDWIWNCFDLFLVITATYDFINEYIVSNDSGGANLMWMRLLRIVKMLKLMRMVRVMRFFRELRMMMNLIKTSLRSLLWAAIMIGLIMYMFALAFVQGVTGYLDEKFDSNESIDPQVALALGKYWTNVHDAVCTLLMAVTRGVDWDLASKPLEEVGQVYHILFLFYISFATFAVLNVLTGIFVDASFDGADADRKSVEQEALKLAAAQAGQFNSMLSQWCTAPELLSKDELLQCCAEDKKVVEILSDMEIEEKELIVMFDMLKKVHHIGGKVRVKDISDALMCLKGPAQAMDVVQLSCTCKLCGDSLEHFMIYCEDQLLSMRRALQLKFQFHGKTLLPLKKRLQNVRTISKKVLSQ